MGPLGNAVSSKNGHDINPLDEVLLVRNPKESLFVPLGKQASSNVVFDEATQGLAAAPVPRYDQTHRRPQPVDLPRGNGGDGPGGDDQGGDDQGGDDQGGVRLPVPYPSLPSKVEIKAEIEADVKSVRDASTQLSGLENQVNENDAKIINELRQMFDQAVADNVLQEEEIIKLGQMLDAAEQQIEDIRVKRQLLSVRLMLRAIRRRRLNTRLAFERFRNLKRKRPEMVSQETQMDRNPQRSMATQMDGEQVDSGTQMESADRSSVIIERMRQRILRQQRENNHNLRNSFMFLQRHSNNKAVRQLRQQVGDIVLQLQDAIDSQDRQQLVAVRDEAIQLRNNAVQNFRGNMRDVARVAQNSIVAIGDTVNGVLQYGAAAMEAIGPPLLNGTIQAAEAAVRGLGSAGTAVVRVGGQAGMQALESGTRLGVDAVAGGSRLGRDMERGGGNFIQNAWQYTRNALAGLSVPRMIGASAPNNTAAPNPEPSALEDAQYDDEPLALGDAQYDDEEDVQEAPAQQGPRQRKPTKGVQRLRLLTQIFDLAEYNLEERRQYVNMFNYFQMGDLQYIVDRLAGISLEMRRQRLRPMPFIRNEIDSFVRQMMNRISERNQRPTKAARQLQDDD